MSLVTGTVCDQGIYRRWIPAPHLGWVLIVLNKKNYLWFYWRGTEAGSKTGQEWLEILTQKEKRRNLFFLIRHIKSFLPLCERACGPSNHTAFWRRHDSTCTGCSAARRHRPPPQRLFSRRKNRRREPAAHPPPRRWRRHGRERFACVASAGWHAWSPCRRRSRCRRCVGSVPLFTIYLSFFCELPLSYIFYKRDELLKLSASTSISKFRFFFPLCEVWWRLKMSSVSCKTVVARLFLFSLMCKVVYISQWMKNILMSVDGKTVL